MTDLENLIRAVEGGNRPWREPGETDWPHAALALLAFDGSLDAAQRLHDALLPGWQWELCSDTPDTMALIWPGGQCHNTIKGGFETFGEGNPARAWLLAILRAVAATTDAREGV